jgi:hypothetical protein
VLLALLSVGSWSGRRTGSRSRCHSCGETKPLAYVGVACRLPGTDELSAGGERSGCEMSTEDVRRTVSITGAGRVAAAAGLLVVNLAGETQA